MALSCSSFGEEGTIEKIKVDKSAVGAYSFGIK